MAKDQDEADREFRRNKVWQPSPLYRLEDYIVDHDRMMNNLADLQKATGYIRVFPIPDGDAFYEEDATLP